MNVKLDKCRFRIGMPTRCNNGRLLYWLLQFNSFTVVHNTLDTVSITTPQVRDRMVGVRVTNLTIRGFFESFTDVAGRIPARCLVSHWLSPRRKSAYRRRISIRAPRFSLKPSCEVELHTGNGAADVASLSLVRMVIHMRTQIVFIMYNLWAWLFF